VVVLEVFVCTDCVEIFRFQRGDFATPANQVIGRDIEPVEFSGFCSAQPWLQFSVIISRSDFRSCDALTGSSCPFFEFGEDQIAEFSPARIAEDKEGLFVLEPVFEVHLCCSGMSRGRVTCKEAI